MNILLTNPIIIILTVIALIITVSAKFVKHRYVSEGLSILGFLLVIACITYALLLGAELADVLVYVLLFALIGAIAFIPSSDKSDLKNIHESSPDNEQETDEKSTDIKSKGEEEEE